jgi:hypothetical protein
MVLIICARNSEASVCEKGIPTHCASTITSTYSLKLNLGTSWEFFVSDMNSSPDDVRANLSNTYIKLKEISVRICQILTALNCIDGLHIMP